MVFLRMHIYVSTSFIVTPFYLMRRILILQPKTLLFHFISVQLFLFQFCHLLCSCVCRTKIWILFSLPFLKENIIPNSNSQWTMFFFKLNAIRKNVKRGPRLLQARFILKSVGDQACQHVMGACRGLGGHKKYWGK